MLEHPQLEQRYQPLAIGMQKAKVARTPKTFGQHMLQHQAQELRTGNGARGASLGFAVAPAVGHGFAVAAQDVSLLNIRNCALNRAHFAYSTI